MSKPLKVLIVEDDENGIGIVNRSFQPVDIAERGDISNAIDLAPALPSIFGDLYQTIVGTGVDESFDDGGFG